MFPGSERSFRIISVDSECNMTQKDYDYRLLMIHSSILNERRAIIDSPLAIHS